MILLETLKENHYRDFLVLRHKNDIENSRNTTLCVLLATVRPCTNISNNNYLLNINFKHGSI